MSQTLRLVVGLVVVAAAGLSAQAGQPPPAAGTGLIAGRVVDADGATVADVVVFLRPATATPGPMRPGGPGQPVPGRTNAEGRFVFTAVPAGQFMLQSTKPGWLPGAHGKHSPTGEASPLEFENGQVRNDLTITIWRPGVIGAEPVTVITDDLGRYRTYGLPPGEYTVGTSWYYHGQGFDVRLPSDAEFSAAFPAPGQTATPARPGAPAAATPPRYNYAPVFAPGVTDPFSAATYTLSAGEIREGVDLQMRFDATSRIEGTVVNPGGPPLAVGLTVTRRSPVQALNTSQVSGTGADGRFATSSLSPGQYTVLVETSRRSYEGPALWAMADVFLSSGEPSVITMTLAPALTVTGQVVFEGTTLPPPKDLTRLSVTCLLYTSDAADE